MGVTVQWFMFMINVLRFPQVPDIWFPKGKGQGLPLQSESIPNALHRAVFSEVHQVPLSRFRKGKS